MPLQVAKMPLHLKKSMNQADLENGASERIGSHPEKELELNGLENPDDIQIRTVTQQPLQQYPEKPKPTCPTAKNQVTIETSAFNSNARKTKAKTTRILRTILTKIKVVKQTQTSTIIQKDRRLRPVYPPCETCAKTNHSTKKCYFGAIAANRSLPRNRRPEGQNQVQQWNTQSNSDGNVQAADQTLN